MHGVLRYRLFVRAHHRLLDLAKPLVARVVDRAYGISTQEQVSPERLGYEPGSGYLHYQASSWLSVPGMFSDWTPAPGRADVILDLGCGKGRALVQLARRCPVGRVVGLELNAGLADVARANLVRTRGRHRAAAFEVHVGDARTWEIPEDVTIVYLANPFDGVVFDEAMQRLFESYDRRPRALQIAYVHPIGADRLLATGRVQERPHAGRWWMQLAGVDPREFRRFDVLAAGSTMR